MRLDREILATLRALGGEAAPGFLNELIDTYLVDSVGMLAAIENAAAAGDNMSLFKAAHGLKGCCGNLGANLLAMACASLQTAAESGDANRVRVGVAEVSREFRATDAALRTFRYS